MRWENNTDECPRLSETEIPGELLDGLERLSADAAILKARLRWRPHETAATGFLTKDRLLDLHDQPAVEIARALASLAHHLHDQGGCESKFEAQVQRELEASGTDTSGQREWRSITFYVHPPEPEPSYVPHDDDPYEPSRYASSSWDERPDPPTPTSSIPNYAEYATFVELSRTDPTAFAMIVAQQSNDRIVNVLERLLNASASRLDRVLGTQISNSRYLNEALRTLTKGASEVAGLGVDLFNRGLEGQARVARMEHETELGKERTELMRDAVKHGSLLVQAVLMANQTKQQPSAASAAAPQPTPRAGVPTTPPPSPTPTGPTSVPQSVDDEIEFKTRNLLELMTDDALEDLRRVAPSLASVFDELRAEPVTADRVRAVIHDAQTRVDPVELGLASKQFGAEISHAFGVLVMRVLSEDRS